MTPALLLLLAMNPSDPPLTLEAAQAEARLHAPEAAEIEARMAAASVLAADARRVFRDDPTLAVRQESGNGDESASEITFGVPLDVSGSWIPRRKSAESRMEAAGMDREDALRSLDEAVAVAVAELAFAQRSAARATRIAALQRIAYDAARREREVGKGSALDEDAASLEDAVARRGESEAAQRLAEAQARLARLLGRTSPESIVAADPTEPTAEPSPPDTDALVDRAPSVRAAVASAQTARWMSSAENRRLVRPLDVELGWSEGRKEIPADAFARPGPGAARWNDAAASLRIAIPLPLFDRNREARASAQVEVLETGSRAVAIRAEQRMEIQIAWSRFLHALRGAQALAGAEETVERDLGLLEKAFAAGAMDSVTRANALRRVEAAAEEADRAILELRLARAAWIRHSSS